MTQLPPILLLHGAATGPAVYDQTIRHLHNLFQANGLPAPEIRVPQRPQNGDWHEEVAHLLPLVHGAFVVGVSGGATLGWELLTARNIATTGCVPLGALLHEPAAGSLAPGLLAHVARALESDGLEGFGKALYGRAWKTAMATVNTNQVSREFAMFGSFEPYRLAALTRSNTVLTTGTSSPLSRHNSVDRMSEEFGVRVRRIPGSHAVHIENPHTFAQAILCHYDSCLSVVEQRTLNAS